MDNPKIVYIKSSLNDTVIHDEIRLSEADLKKHDTDGSMLNVEGHVMLHKRSNKGYMPYVFDSITGDFCVSDTVLEHLQGSPRYIGGSFNCSHNKLHSLIKGPKLVSGNYVCSSNRLLSLKGAPKEASSFYCDKNQLVSLKHAPKRVLNTFDCSKNKLGSFDGVPMYMDCAYFNDNLFMSLKGIHQIKTCRKIWLGGNVITEGGIGLIMIDELEEVLDIKSWDAFYAPLKIITKYFGKGKPALLECAEELCDSGFEDYARI